ncbi:MAG: ferrous iron transport protein B [Spirochaetes bacterium]|nr:ferrous iron transport protein B [Spirochaetota bacterium]
MPDRSSEKKIVVAIGGNPNSGKTTIFNELTGSRQKVGNWGGVTVEKIEGTVNYNGYHIVFVDLPGTYSLTAYSIEEIIARNFIVEERPDVVVDIIDSGNLERNLYLAVQMIELGGDFIFVLNMADMAKKQGLLIDADKLGSFLGGPVLFTVGNRGIGVKAILDGVIDVYEQRATKTRTIQVPYGNEIEEEISTIQAKVEADSTLVGAYPPRWLGVKLLENDSDVQGKIRRNSEVQEAIAEQVAVSRKHLRDIFDEEAENIIADQRYGFISGLLQESVSLGTRTKQDLSQKIDKVLTNRLLGIPLLVLFIWIMFQVTFNVGSFPMRWIDTGVGLLSGAVSFLLPDGIFKSLIVDGIIGGVGGVAIFLPNILLLFFMISIFEDTGYMARAAFVMDRVMHLIGLHGKSFISMIMGFGCNVPAIMATRTLENEKDRVLTILINPLMSCSARLPVYVLIAGTFFGKRAGNVIFSLYALGVVLAIIVGRLFRKTLFRGESEPFVMELPPYRIPTLKSVVIHMWERAVLFLRKMGTVILVGSVVIWFFSSFPVNRAYRTEFERKKAAVEERYEGSIDSLRRSASGDSEISAELTALIKERDEALLDLAGEKKQQDVYYSFIGRMGRSIEPFFRPLGFSWREGVALITGFVAKEVVVSTLGVLYAGGGEEDELGFAVRERSGLTPLTAFAFLVFVLIYTPCLATLAAVRQETGSWRWTLFSVGYQITLAWLMAFAVVKVGALVT